jgi:hypothetical protein
MLNIQVHSYKVHGSRLGGDEDRANSKVSMNKPEERVLQFIDLSNISRNMKRTKQPTVNLTN